MVELGLYLYGAEKKKESQMHRRGDELLDQRGSGNRNYQKLGKYVLH